MHLCARCVKEQMMERSDNGVDESMDLGNGVHLEDVGKFRYLGDMLNGGGGADFASVAKVRCAWRKFKIVVRDLDEEGRVFKAEREGVYVTCVRSAMVYGSETWAMNVDQSQPARLERAGMRMVQWMCGVSLRDRVPNAELGERMGIELVSEVVKRNRLRWLEHVLRKDDGGWVNKSMS